MCELVEKITPYATLEIVHTHTTLIVFGSELSSVPHPCACDGLSRAARHTVAGQAEDAPTLVPTRLLSLPKYLDPPYRLSSARSRLAFP